MAGVTWRFERPTRPGSVTSLPPAANGEVSGCSRFGYVDELRTAGPTGDPTLDYGMGWWLPTDLGNGVLEGIGRGGQELLVLPAEGLVVVVTGAQADGRLIARTRGGHRSRSATRSIAFLSRSTAPAQS